MMNRKKIKEKHPAEGPAELEKENGEPAFNLTNAACATECTGLIQVPPKSEEELENYNDVYSFTTDKAQAPKK